MKAERAAAELAALVGWQNGPRGAAAGWAAPGRAGRERGREKKAGLAGLGQKVTFSLFLNHMFINFYFLHFHF